MILTMAGPERWIASSARLVLQRRKSVARIRVQCYAEVQQADFSRSAVVIDDGASTAKSDYGGPLIALLELSPCGRTAVAHLRLGRVARLMLDGPLGAGCDHAHDALEILVDYAGALDGVTQDLCSPAQHRRQSEPAYGSGPLPGSDGGEAVPARRVAAE